MNRISNHHPAWPRRTTLTILLVVFLPAMLSAQDTAKLGDRTGRAPVKLWPLADEKKAATQPAGPLEINDWRYQTVKSSNPRDGVPWELIVEPIGRNAEIWNRGADDWRAIPMLQPSLTATLALSAKAAGAKPTKENTSVPVITMPQSVWQQQMDAELQKAVGIHFHELVTDDVVRILLTVHKVPPDEITSRPADGRESPVGTRLEATLLTPVIFSLDQTIAIRKDPLDKDEAVQSRAQHEVGHAALTQEVFLAILRGPQNWDPARFDGYRSRLAYYWRREQIGRTWEGYRGNVGQLLTLRTSVVLVPPTRWSMLLPTPPERVTQLQIQSFNDFIVQAALRFEAVDREAQKQFHARHGTYESAAP